METNDESAKKRIVIATEDLLLVKQILSLAVDVMQAGTVLVLVGVVCVTLTRLEFKQDNAVFQGSQTELEVNKLENLIKEMMDERKTAKTDA